ncbi:hypothetical protein NEOLEDRAFT_1089923 [Neolentinus lepideus HHB14362 ss-1]|uniref:Glycerophosphocholine acyltransferase 1 n=1 Tax=Neolentinus lepideus HHB14362 ss-1 TaxID=1314782 RepID=A0A165TR89_9AGAM|nr:hypothetical protein NEOLEDRAFT_1089923 [Neolentinus lepideus HHB14362 ss-1]
MDGEIAEEHQSRPPLSRAESSAGMGFFSLPFERFSRDEASEWASAFTLLDTLETYFDSRIDLLQRSLAKQTDKLKLRAEEALRIGDFKIRTPSGDALSKDFEREVGKFRLKVQTRMTSLASAWQSAKVVRTREKMSFFYGVHSLLISALLFGMAPEWIHISYTLQALYLLPMRAYKYKKRAWHYFLFDLCYYVTILNFIYIWLLPGSATLFTACYCLSHGSLASAVITWRNSLVFHDSDKVTSLFIHIYAPFTFTVIRHFYPNAESRFPALKELPHLQPVKALLFSGLIYVIWQLLYWKFVLIDRRKKIESGQRTTSFSFLLNDKRGVIGRALSKFPPQYREAAFMGGQLVYAILTELPAACLLYDSPRWSNIFLSFIFAVSVWNGGGFYIEVFGRKFERELEALRKELAEAQSRSGRSSPTSGLEHEHDETPEIQSEMGSPRLTPREMTPITATLVGASLNSGGAAGVPNGDAKKEQ